MKNSKKCYKHEKPFILKHNPSNRQINKYCLSKCSKRWYKRLLRWNFSWMSRGYNPKNFASELYPFIWRKLERKTILEILVWYYPDINGTISRKRKLKKKLKY